MKNIILIGMKACGKSTAGKIVVKKLDMEFIELDGLVEALHEKMKGEDLSCRQIFKIHGETYFRALETECLQTIARARHTKPFLLSCGGGTPMYKVNCELLKNMGTIVFLDVGEDILLSRIRKIGTPAFFTDKKDAKKSLGELLAARRPVYEEIADIHLLAGNDDSKRVAGRIVERISV